MRLRLLRHCHRRPECILTVKVDLTLGELRSIGCTMRQPLVLAADCGRMTAQNAAICSEIIPKCLIKRRKPDIKWSA
jgi:hypothetical protein